MDGKRLVKISNIKVTVRLIYSYSCDKLPKINCGNVVHALSKRTHMHHQPRSLHCGLSNTRIRSNDPLVGLSGHYGVISALSTSLTEDGRTGLAYVCARKKMIMRNKLYILFDRLAAERTTGTMNKQKGGRGTRVERI